LEIPRPALEKRWEGTIETVSDAGRSPFLPNRSIDARKLRFQEARQSGPTRSFGHGFSTLLSKKCIEWAAFFFGSFFWASKRKDKKIWNGTKFIRAIGTQSKGIKKRSVLPYGLSTIFA
jgi:hypothetical protein